MKTLIFDGSPRKEGNTASLIHEFTRNLEGEFKIIDVFESNIHSCIDCRYCRNHDGCSQRDDMQEVYGHISRCDNILIASPVFFTELTGQLLAVASRLQTYFCARYFRKEEPIAKVKKGGIILLQGGTYKAEKAADTAAVLLKTMNATRIAPALFCLDTDNTSPEANAAAMAKAKEIADFFNEP